MQRGLRRVVLASLLLLGLTVALNLWPALTGNPVAGSLVQAVALPVRAVDRAERAAGGAWERYLHLRGVEEERTALRAQMDSYRLERMELGELRSENARLRRLLDFSVRQELQPRAARVFATPFSPNVRRLFINRGSDDGFETGYPVVTHEGVVGRLGRIQGPGMAEVILLNDPESRVDVFIGPQRVRGILAGTGEPRLQVLYVDWDLPIRADDWVVTSGLSDFFPKGMPVGRVVQVESPPGELFLTIRVEPQASLKGLEELLVLLPDNAAGPPVRPDPDRGEIDPAPFAGPRSP